MKKEKYTQYLRRLVFALAAVVFVYSGFMLVNIFFEYREGTEEYKELEDLIFSKSLESVILETTAEGFKETSLATDMENGILKETETETEPETTVPEVEYVDFPTLKSMNPDAAGWITMYGTKINYPVVQGTDNEYYMNHTFTGKQNAAGSIFIDASISQGMEAENVIVYGHNMKNGSMFGTLSYYKNEQMAKNYPAFLVYTEEGTYEYAIFAAFTTTAGSDTYIYGFGSEESFLGYVDRMKSQSLYDTGITVNPGDKLMTLSTCSGKGNNRFVVLAKRLEP